jgi:hypothetical protein
MSNIIEDFQKNGKRVLVVSEVRTEEQLKAKEGHFFTDADFPICLRENCDVYGVDADGNIKPVLKLRKRVIPKHICTTAFENLEQAAKRKTDNRGSAAGMLDMNKLPTHAKDVSSTAGKFYINGYTNADGKFVKANIGNAAMSNIIGYYDKPNRNIGKGAPPCRLTAFTGSEPEKWEKVVPLLEHADAQFKQLFPKQHKLQYKAAHETEFVIGKTAFSTVTINYNWRTALHKDSGDFQDGFGNLLVLERGKYTGGHTGFPRYGVCVDLRQGDFLAMDVHDWHANTPLVGQTPDYARLSVVCYLREDMHRCKGLRLADAIEATRKAKERRWGK